MAQVLTANRLVAGDVVYWRQGAWVEAFDQADIFEDGVGAKTALAAARQSVAANLVVSPYLFDVTDGRPLKEREIIRALGPSVRLDVGKQAGHQHPFAKASPGTPVAERDDDVSI